MAVFGTSDFTLPVSVAEGMFSKVSTGSAVLALSQATPMKFGNVTELMLTGRPKAQYVSEAAAKSNSKATITSKVVVPQKVQITQRFNEEVLWADEDYQLVVLDRLTSEAALSIARALDLGVFHGVDPRSGGLVANIAVSNRIATTTNNREIATADLTNGKVTSPDLLLENVVGQIIADGYVPTGVAFDTGFAYDLATARFSDGRKKFDGLGYGQTITAFEGLPAFSSSTVSAPEATAATGVKAIVGQWDALSWGVQRELPVEVIRFGDPDGDGDLKRFNQVALRLETVFAWAVLDLDAFGTITDKVANV